MLPPKFKLWLALLLTILVTAGCATLPPESKHAHITPELLARYQEHQMSLAGLSQWQASGKMALISPAEKQSSRLNWKQSPQLSKLTLTNMLGITLLEASQTSQGASIEINGENHQGSSLHDLIHQLAGFRLPVQAMPSWLTGNVDLAQAENLSLDENGYLLGFHQTVADWGEWQVSYNGYYPATPKMPALPSRITLKHPELTLKLLIHRWN